jgi:hypothetical protein
LTGGIDRIYAINMIEPKIDRQRKNIDPKVWKKLRLLAIQEEKTIAEIMERALLNEFKRLEAKGEK